MRKNVDSRQRVIIDEIVTYVACDGKEFDTEEECKQWEQDYKCTLGTTYNNIAKANNSYVRDAIPYVNEDCRVDFLKPKTEEEITTINAIWRILTGDSGDAYLTFNDIGKIIVADFGYVYNDNCVFDCDWLTLYKLDEYINSINKGYEALIQGFECKEQEVK